MIPQDGIQVGFEERIEFVFHKAFPERLGLPGKFVSLVQGLVRA